MNDALKRLADVDPASARELHRYQKWSRVIAALAIIAVLGTAYAIAVNIDQGKEIVQIQHSACQVDPAGHECQQTKREASLASNLAVTCITLTKAGYPCPKPGSRVAERHSKGVVTLNGHSPSSLPGPPSSGPQGQDESQGGQGVPPTAPATPNPQPTPEPVSGKDDNSALLTPTVEQLPPPAQPAVEAVCSVAAHLAHLC